MIQSTNASLPMGLGTGILLTPGQVQLEAQDGVRQPQEDHARAQGQDVGLRHVDVRGRNICTVLLSQREGGDRLCPSSPPQHCFEGFFFT